jgi:hypothetical protein
VARDKYFFAVTTEAICIPPYPSKRCTALTDKLIKPNFWYQSVIHHYGGGTGLMDSVRHVTEVVLYVVRANTPRDKRH